ncbi:hypothetical protein [Baaleninema simplex]|nr:hypothetical protein [Baaleninema simplex]
MLQTTPHSTLESLPTVQRFRVFFEIVSGVKPDAVRSPRTWDDLQQVGN